MTNSMYTMRSNNADLIIEQRVMNEGPTNAVAYAMWWFLGILGGHRFYFGQVGTGFIMLLLTLTGVGAIITVPWWIIDFFKIKRQLIEKRNELRRQLQIDNMLSGK